LRLYIVRHADPDYEKDVLTTDGILEAKELAKYLATQEIKYIYSSPMGRAVETMAYTSSILGITSSIEDWLKELPDLWLDHSEWGFINAFDIPGEVIRKKAHPTHENWHELDCYQNVNIKEKVEAMLKNADEFIKRHGYERIGGRYLCLNSNEDRIALFCHRGNALTWLAHLLGIPLTLVWSGFWMATSSVTIIDFEERSCRWAVPRCISFGDTSHLYKAQIAKKLSDLPGVLYPSYKHYSCNS
jgi:broad specificity phosphatase PhoE